jgi:hypothetical protein
MCIRTGGVSGHRLQACRVAQTVGGPHPLESAKGGEASGKVALPIRLPKSNLLRSLAHVFWTVENFYQHLVRSGPSGFVCIAGEPRLYDTPVEDGMGAISLSGENDAKTYRRCGFGLRDFDVGNGWGGPHA